VSGGWQRTDGRKETMSNVGFDVIPIMKTWLGAEEATAAAEAITSGWVAQGPRVAAFEEAVARKVGAADGVAVSSCTTALHLSLVVLDIGPGDEVIVPSLSFIATANVARHVGATPVFCDVDPATQNLTAASIAQLITPATRVVILVHQAGVPADIDAIRDVCEPKGIAIIEDAACAIGSMYRDRPIGGLSEFVCFSFHPRKVITTGEGGMIMSSREDVSERLRRLREHGMNVSAADRHASRDLVIEQYLETGFNFRMTDIQAAVGIVQLTRLDAIVDGRRQRALRYQRRLEDIPGLDMVKDPPYGRTNFQSFWIVLPDEFPMERDTLLRTMMERGISPRRGIMASHLEPAYAGSAHAPLPVTERLTERSLLLPLFQGMTDEQQDRVIAVVREAAGMGTE
jgi:dTDP-4-amino-4,6-dideoxygalactose transaminase